MSNETVTIPAMMWRETLVKIDVIKEQLLRLQEEPRTDQETYWKLESDKIALKWVKALVELEREKHKNESLIKAGLALALLQSPTDCSPEQVKRQCVLDWVKASEDMEAK